MIEVRTQAQLDKALKKAEPYELIALLGDGFFTVEASDSATVRAFGSATVRASGSATVRASKYVAVTVPANASPKVTGGVLIQLPKLDTAKKWCEFYGVEVKEIAGKHVATLFKALDDNFVSGHGTAYTPGSTPAAPDWDGGAAECGGGLHFSPRPHQALSFAYGATKFVACPVRLSEIVVHPDGMYPEKIKAPRVVAPGCYEVDVDGEPV